MLGIVSHPICVILLQLFLIATFNGFTDSRSPLRLYLGLLVVAFLAWYSMTTSFNRTQSSFLGGVLGSPPTAFLLQYIDTALIGKWDIGLDGPTKILGRDAGQASTPSKREVSDKWKEPDDARRRRSGQYFGIWPRMMFGLRSIFDIRGVDKPWESKNVPHFSSINPRWVPGKRHFLWMTAMKLGVACVVSSYLGATPAVLSISTHDLYDHSKIHVIGRLSEITWYELLIRFITTVKQFVLIICGLEMAFGLVAIPAIVFGIREPKHIRPLFNSPFEAYTVRRFWSPFFHQIWRRRFDSVAYVFTFDVLGLRKQSVAARYCTTIIVFLLSGLLHFGQNIAEGMPWQKSGAVTFFVAQAVAIAFEDLIGHFTGLRGREPSLWLKVLGYVWVLSFLSLVGPHWIYPAL